MERLFLVGPGRAGLALAHALHLSGKVSSIVFCGREPHPPRHPLFTSGVASYTRGLASPSSGTTAVVLSVPDAAVSEVAWSLAGQGPPPEDCVAFHLSGALSLETLEPLRRSGYAVGTLHPLQALADWAGGATLLKGAYFALSGDPHAVHTGARLVSHLGGTTLMVPATRRPLYHAAAVMASNHVLGLVLASARILAAAGVSGEEGLRALTSLARGALDNLERLGPEKGLTGPVVRGDVETVRLHLSSLEAQDRVLYALLARELLDIVPSSESRVDNDLGSLLEGELDALRTRGP